MQREDGLCGFACLEMILFARGYRVPSLQAGRTGFTRSASIATLLHTAAGLGLNGRAFALVQPKLSASWCPAILRIDNMHFVVVVEIRDEEVVLADPAYGFRVQSIAGFVSRVNDVVLFD